jgi:hypothetical protein
VPAERLLPTLDATPRLGSVFGARRRTRGLRFTATDVGWRWDGGHPSAPEVRGPGEALLMTMLGRRQPLDELDGPGLGEFRTRVLR